eukprot:865480_1
MRRKRASYFSGSRESFDGDLSAFTNNLHSDDMIVFKSWMKKKDNRLKAMQQLYCIVYNDRKLAYFKNATDTNLSGFIDLSTVSAINMYRPQAAPLKGANNEFVNIHQM